MVEQKTVPNFIAAICKSVFNFGSKQHNDHSYSSPADGPILKLHYKFSFRILLLIFSVVWFTWYRSDPMECTNPLNSEQKLPPHLMGSCLAYLYVEDEDSTRHYLFFYRYLPYGFFYLALISRIPETLCEFGENRRTTSLFHILYKPRSNYDQNTENNILHTVSMYLNNNFLTHNMLYCKALCSTVFVLVLDISIWFFLDFILDNRFIPLGLLSTPFKRDTVNHSDYLSQTFPPFALCEINPLHQLVSERKDMFGCHLVLTEFYEKAFLVLWIWLVILTAATCLYLIFQLLFIFPAFRRFVLRTQVPDSAKVRKFTRSRNFRQDHVEQIVEMCKIGDAWLLHILKHTLSSCIYYRMLMQFVHPSDEGFSLLVPNDVQFSGKQD